MWSGKLMWILQVGSNYCHIVCTDLPIVIHKSEVGSTQRGFVNTGSKIEKMFLAMRMDQTSGTCNPC